MKLSVLTVPLSGMPFEKALDFLAPLGVEAVEIGCGGFPGNAHCNPAELLNKPEAIKAYKAALAERNMSIAALSCHGNPVHPNKDIAKKAHDEFTAAVELANQLEVETVITFSGCPGGSPEDKTPNWVTCPWPDDFTAVLNYQWNDVLIPYWQKTGEFVKSRGVRVAFEMHPGFCVYNPETMLKIRAACGDVLGANLDPSHLIWQGIELPAAIRALEGAIYHVHAKDTKIDKINTAVNGVLDTKHYGDEIHRSWIFRSMGYGNDMAFWKDVVSNLRLVGYDHVLSIEHEDSLMSSQEGLKKAISFVRDIIISEPRGEMFWA